jgi:hypothetical protein
MSTAAAMVMVSILPSAPCKAEGVAGSPSFAVSPAPVLLAQAPIPPSLYPTDVTNVGIHREQELFRGPTLHLFDKLPARLWFNQVTEVSQRYESNVFLTSDKPRSDYVFRVLPNTTLGYNIFKTTSIYANYFVLKDVFAEHGKLSLPTTQSISAGLRHEKVLGDKTSLQFDFQARELFQAVHLHQADLIPGVTLTHVFNPTTIAFVNVLLQMRGRNYFVAPTREIDPFYTVGWLKMHGLWVCTAAGTLVTNFRHPPFNDAIPFNSNNSIIVDLEVSHPIHKRIPNLVMFTRAEPIFNWHSHNQPGISGFDFRIFTGLRYTIVKPSYGTSMERLRKQLQSAGPAQVPIAVPSNMPPPTTIPVN